MPGDIRDIPGRYWPAGKESVAHKTWMPPAQPNHTADKLEHVPFCLDQAPIEPGKLVILTPSIVVPVLSPQNLVASHQHGNTATGHQNCDEVLRLAAAQCDDSWVIRFAFSAAVPTQIIVAAIPVIFPVIFIVFVIVAD